MAIVVESTSSSSDVNVSSVTVTKPTGLAVGELMVAITQLWDSADTVSTESGWTLYQAAIGSDLEINVQYKIADSADVAASNFTFDASGSVSYLSTTVFRISGFNTLSPMAGFDFENAQNVSSATVSFSSSLTPVADGSLVILAFNTIGGSGSTVAFGSYTVTGGSVSFTEALDVAVDNVAADPSYCIAYGTQTTATTITAYGVTANGVKEDWLGFLLVITPRVDASSSNSLVTTTSSTFTQAGTADAIGGTNTLVTATSEAFTHSGKGSTPTQWSTETKPSTTWNNETL